GAVGGGPLAAQPGVHVQALGHRGRGVGVEVLRHARASKRIGTELVPHSAQRAIAISPQTSNEDVRASASSRVVIIMILASGAPGQVCTPPPKARCLERLGRSNRNVSPSGKTRSSRLAEV